MHRSARWWKVAVAAMSLSWLVAGCGQTNESGQNAFWGTAGETASPEDSGSDDDDDDGDGPDDDDAPGETGDAPGDSGAGDPSSGDIPCEVADIINANCRTCHSDPPKYGAPDPLTMAEHFRVPATTDPTKTIGEMAVDRMGDTARPMPPGGVLSDAERDLVAQWIAQGAPSDPDADCAEPDDGGGTNVDIPCDDPVELLAHGDGEAPFQVPVADDAYMCFTFKSPFAAGDQGIATAPIIDDERVVHHWILYRTSTPQADGGFGPCNMPLDSTFVTGWAPGGDGSVMPPDVGMELAGPDEWLILQVHYNNVAGYTDALDKSGVAICRAETPRPYLAGILWLGSVYIGIPPGAQNYEVTGVCSSSETSGWSQPLHVMASSPHMHERGRRFRTEIRRGGPNGASDMLVDVPFDFNSQDAYPNDPPIVINPGDELISTCTYDNPGAGTVYFGEGTSDEMCFNFVMAFPIDAVPNRFCGIVF